MARPIDEKIVAMKMDNSDFKRKAVETTSLFGKLTNALNKIPGVDLSKITNDLGGIQKAANGVDMGSLSRSIESISGRLSNLGIVAATVLTNISNRAVDTGVRLAKSLSTDQIIAGFQEYELKMGSIQTILANTTRDGTTLEQVNKEFAELNEYADKTIYNFGDMTRNIGLFTNAGLGLEESVSMIKGFSNAAAASGANAEQAARAAYQLSQGLASGYLMQMDWMSLTNAGMGNDNMKRDLIALGQAMGTLNVETEDAVQQWKTLLSDEKWLTSDVMSTYLQAMAGDMSKAQLMAKGLSEEQANILLQNAKIGNEAATYVRTFTQMMNGLKESIGSGWAQSFEIIFGDFNEATKLWTGISNFISPFFTKQAENRNALLSAVFEDGKALGNLFKGFGNVLKPIGQIFTSIGSGFKAAFPPMSATGLRGLIDGFMEFTQGLRFSEGTVNNLTTIFEGFFSVFAIGWKVIKGAVAIVMSMLPSFEGLGAKIVELISKVASMPIAFNNASDSGEAFQSFLNGLSKVADVVAKGLEFVVGALIVFADALKVAYNMMATGDFSGGPWEADSKIVSKLTNIREAVIGFVDAIKEALSILSTGSLTVGGPWEEDSKIVSALLRIRDGLLSFGNAIMDLEFSMEPFANAFDTFVGALKAGYDWIAGVFSSIGEKIKSSMPSGNDLMAGGFIAGLVGIVGLAIKMAWDFYEVFTGWGKIGTGVTEVLEGVGGALESFGWQVKAQALLTAAFAIGVLAASFWAMSKLDGNQIATGLYAIIGGMTALVGALAIMTKYDVTGTGMEAVIQIVALAVAFRILSGALRNISDMGWEEISKGLVGLIGVMGTFAGVMVVMSKFGGPKLAGSAVQFLAIAGTVYLLVLVLDKIADVDTGKLIKGMTGLAVALGLLSVSVAIMSKNGNVGASALQFVAIAGSILILVEAIRQIADIDVKNLAIGLTTIGLILGAIAAFTVITSGKGLLSSGIGITLLATALNLLLIPVLAFGKMSLETLAKGLGAMAVALLAIGAASMLMQGMIASGAGLILLATGMNMLMVPIAAFAAMPLKALATGIGALAVGILAIGGAAALLGLAGPALLLGAAGIAALGIAMLAAGAGISLFATGLVTLAAMTGTAVTTIVAFLGTLIVGISSLIPKAVDFIWMLNQHMATAFRDNAPILFQTILEAMLGMLGVIEANIPKFVAAGTKIITNFLDSLAQNLPKIVQSAADLMVAFVESLASAVETNGPKFLDAIMRLMAEVLVIVVEAGVAVIQALFGWIPGVTEAANEIGETAEETIREAFDAEEAGEDKGEDFANSLSGKSGEVGAAGEQVGTSAKDGVDIAADLSTLGSEKGQNFASGLTGTQTSANVAGKTIGEAGRAGAGSIDMGTTGANFGEGFAAGISGTIDTVVSAAKRLARAAEQNIREWLDIHSPSRVTEELGEYTGEGFAVGIASKQSDVSKASKDVAKAAKDSFKKEMEVAEYKFKMEEIDSSQYISELKEIRKSYYEYGELVGEVNLEIKKVEEDAAKHRSEIRKADFQASKEWINDRKYYNELSLTEELQAWERVMNRYKEGTEERKEAEREVYRLKNDINDRLISINEEYASKVEEANKRLIESEKELNAEYEKAVEDRTQSLLGFAGIFDEVNKDSEVTGRQLLTNLKTQVKTFEEWSQNIQELANKGIDEGLLKELREMGPRAASQIVALNTLTEEQLAQYSALWMEKNQLARTQALTELEGMKADTEQKIIELRKETNAQLETYKTEWLTKIWEIRVGTTDQFVGLDASMMGIGINSMKGLSRGLESMTPSLMAQARAIARAIRREIEEALDINSPSRVMMQIGEYTGEGLAIGLANKVKRVGDNARELALTAKNSINEFLDGFVLPSMDNEVRLNVVYDYENFDSSRLSDRRLKLIPDTSFVTSNIEATRTARLQNDYNNRSNRDNNVGTKSTVINQNLTFNTPQPTPSETARKNLQASRQLAMKWGN